MIDIPGYDRSAMPVRLPETILSDPAMALVEKEIKEIIQVGELQADLVDQILRAALIDFVQRGGDLMGNATIAITISQEPEGAEETLIAHAGDVVALRDYFAESFPTAHGAQPTMPFELDPATEHRAERFHYDDV